MLLLLHHSAARVTTLTLTRITGVSLHILLGSELGGWRVKYDSV